MDLDCSICYEEFKSSNRAMKIPCGHNICNPCLQKLKPKWVIEGEEVPVACPFCRKYFHTVDCEEDLKVQEAANAEAVSVLQYPFDHAPCSSCSQSTSFADLFVCYACHPRLMQSVFNFEPEKMKNIFLCLTCETVHRPLHKKTPLTTLPISIYTTENVAEIEEIAVPLFHKFPSDDLLAPFAVGLIQSVMTRLEQPQVSQSLLRFVTDTSLEFLDFIKEYTREKEKRTAARLFLKSYWPILTILAGPAFPGLDWAKPMMTALERAARVAFLVQDEGGATEPSPYLAQVAVEEYVWGKCSQILKAMWLQVVAADKGQVGKLRTEAMMQLLSICRLVFANADPVDVLDEIVGGEREAIKEALGLPHLAPDARQEIADYEEQMEEEFELIDLQSAERQINLAEA